MSTAEGTGQQAGRIAIRVWALMIGVLFMGMGNGLQWTLLGIRAIDENFSSTVTGITATGYFIGIFLAARVVPDFLKNVGHVRVFAAAASMASIAILIQSVFIEPWVWMLMRGISGFSFAGLYIVSESWLNEEADNQSRGQLLGIYMVVQLFGMGTGQILINFSDTDAFDLFILVSVLISISLVPMALTKVAQPAVPQTGSLKLKELISISPFGALGAFMSGMGVATVMGMGAVYGAVVGMSVSQIALFVGAVILGPVLLQWPLGRLSDIFDRRLVIIMSCFLAGGMALACHFVFPVTGALSLIGILIVGGSVVSLYSLFLAYLTDFVDKSMIVPLCGMYIAVNGAGAIFAPILAGYALDVVGGGGFWFLIAIIHIFLGSYGLYRMTQRAPLPSEEQAPFTMVASSTLPLASEWSEEVYDYVPETTDDDDEEDVIVGKPKQTPEPDAT